MRGHNFCGTRRGPTSYQGQLFQFDSPKPKHRLPDALHTNSVTRAAQHCQHLRIDTGAVTIHPRIMVELVVNVISRSLFILSHGVWRNKISSHFEATHSAWTLTTFGVVRRIHIDGRPIRGHPSRSVDIKYKHIKHITNLVTLNTVMVILLRFGTLSKLCTNVNLPSTKSESPPFPSPHSRSIMQ